MRKLIELRPNRELSVIFAGNEEADKTLFLLHGLGGRADQWQALIPSLAKKYRIIAPDFFGQGESPSIRKSSAYGFDELLGDILALFDQYKGKENAVIGHSYGGAFTVQLAKQRMNEINCLILLAPMPCTANYPIPFIYRLPVVFMEALRPLLIYEFSKRAFSKNAPVAMKETELNAIQHNPFWIAKALIQGIQKTPKTVLTELNLPTLLIITTEDNLVKPDEQRAFYQALPNVKCIELASGHIVMLEQPQVVNDLLREFLQTYLDKEGMATSGSTSSA